MDMFTPLLFCLTEKWREKKLNHIVCGPNNCGGKPTISWKNIDYNRKFPRSHEETLLLLWSLTNKISLLTGDAVKAVCCGILVEHSAGLGIMNEHMGNQNCLKYNRRVEGPPRSNLCVRNRGPNAEENIDHVVPASLRISVLLSRDKKIDTESRCNAFVL